MNIQQEQTQSSMNVEDRINPNSSNIITNELINGTPFRIIGISDNAIESLKIKKGYFVALGNNRISDILDTWDEALDLIDQKDWNLLFNAICCLIETGKKIK